MMRAWLLLLGGLAVWAAHFTGVYAIASVGAVVSRPDDPAVRASVGALTVACLAADALVLRAARAHATPDGLGAFVRSSAAVGAGLSFVAVIWQGLPALIGH